MASTVIRAAAAAGTAIALYTLYVEHKLSTNEDFDALCDIDTGVFAGASCTTVLSSSYSHILSHWKLVEKDSALDLSNAVMGAAYYVAAFLFDFAPVPNPAAVLLLAATGSLAFSAYLAFILTTQLEDFCVVCCSMYIVNVVIFVAALRLYFTTAPAPASRKKSKKLE